MPNILRLDPYRHHSSVGFENVADLRRLFAFTETLSGKRRAETVSVYLLGGAIDAAERLKAETFKRSGHVSTFGYTIRDSNVLAPRAVVDADRFPRGIADMYDGAMASEQMIPETMVLSQ
jgi:hypothetical protein